MSTSRLDQLLAMLREDPEDTFLRYAAGLEYAGRREYDSALEYLEALRQRNPEYLPTYYQLGAVYEELDRTEDAVQTYRNGIQVGRQQNDLHTVSELQAALDELEE